MAQNSSLQNRFSNSFFNNSDNLVNQVFRICVIVLILLNCFTYGLQNTNNISQKRSTNYREARKLFGGYRITPRFCHPTRTVPGVKGGPSICMFNHECAQRNGHVVGACMDGFLFGACCQLPATTVAGDEMTIPDQSDVVIAQENTINDDATKQAIKPIIQNSDLESTNRPQTVLEIASEDAIVQIPQEENVSFEPMITNSYPNSAETVLIHTNGSEINNYISSEDFTTAKLNNNTSTSRIVESSTKPFYYHSSINYLTARPTTTQTTDKYVLVPTITKFPSSAETFRPSLKNATALPEIESIANIIQMLDDNSPNRIITSETKTPSTISTVVYSNTPVFSSTHKPPSTSYVYSSTIPSRPTYTNPGYSSSTSNKPTTSYLFSPTKRPLTTTTTTKKGSSKKPTKNPPYEQQHYSTNSGQAFTPSPSPAPTVIVLGPISETSSSTVPYNKITVSSTPRPKPVSQVTINNMIQSSNTVHIGGAHRPGEHTTASSEHLSPTVLITPKPSSASTASSYWTTNKQPLTTVIVKRPGSEDGLEYLTTSSLSSSTGDDQINFPPVRNPNLNMSASTTASGEFDAGNFEITTPAFVEDDELNDKVETFVNKIIQSLQGPFDDLRTVIYNNKTVTKKPPTKKPTTLSNTTKKPNKTQTTRKPAVTTKKPNPPKKSTTTTKKPTTQKLTTRRPTTVVTTTKRTKPPVRKTTTTSTSTTSAPSSSSSSEETYEESDEYYEDNQTQQQQQQVPDYKRQCGVRPLMRSGRIVGGKGATFGEWPWQVLVKESTWLGLFTKNKCGGVLISSKYVITAAHCQPGFLASLVAVFGEFDISGELESKRSLSRPVKRVIVHRQYNAATFENDLALLELDTPVTFDTHIVPICLPPDEEDFTGRMATVTGWGRLKYGGGVPSVLQEVQVPIMENSVCQEMFRTAGHSKVIIESFLCAGYANGQKDSCEGDSGGPLTLQRGDGRWELAGTVSHGIKCAAPYLPGVYMRTTYFKPWLTSITGVH